MVQRFKDNISCVSCCSLITIRFSNMDARVYAVLLLYSWLQEKLFLNLNSVHLRLTLSAWKIKYLLVCFLSSFEKLMDLVAIEQLFYVGSNNLFNFITHQSNNTVYWTTLTIKVAHPSFKHLNILLLFWYNSHSCSISLYLFSHCRFSCSFFGAGCIIFKSSLGFLCSTRTLCISFSAGLGFVCVWKCTKLKPL